MNFNWKEIYSVGVPEIDDQHRKLFQILNDLYISQEQGKDSDTLHNLLNELCDYAIYHFKSEEDLLKEKNYPDIDRHIEEHNYFRLQIAELQKMSRQRVLLLNTKLIIFLKDWVFTHVLGSDKEYSRFLKVIER